MFVIGITTYNRKEYLFRMAQSLFQAKNSIPYEIRIYDDASNEFDEHYLKQLFPKAIKIIVNRVNVGADLNTFQMYCDFLNNYSDTDFLFNADSDLIFSDYWIDKSLELVNATDGVLSVFNAFTHEAFSTNDKRLCEKELMGAAGTIFAYSILQQLIFNMGYTKQYVKDNGVDIGWSKILRSNGIKLYCTRASLVQHIGFNGFNSNMSSFDFGTDFTVDSAVNGQILNDSLFDGLSKKRKVTHFQIFPFARIPKGSRVVIYGRGKTAADYMFQIEKTNYCEVIAIVDRSFTDMEADFYIAPTKISMVQYDFIIIASIIPDVIESIKSDLVKNGITDFSNVITEYANIVDVTKLDGSLGIPSDALVTVKSY